MSRFNAWSEVVLKVKNNLSTWKAKTLSLGGGVTLIKSVLGAIPMYYMSFFKVPEGILSQLEGLRNAFFSGADTDERKITWVCWRKVMAQKQHGGLGISSLLALNLAMLFKWIWRFLSSQSGLWINVIKAIHGNNGSIDQPFTSRLRGSVWIGVVKAIVKLKAKGVDLMDFCKLVTGNGNISKFWLDKWYGDVCFKEKFPRIYNLETNKGATVAYKFQSSDFAFSFRRHPRSGVEESQYLELLQLLSSVVLSSANDRWSWTLNG